MDYTKHLYAIAMSIRGLRRNPALFENMADGNLRLQALSGENHFFHYGLNVK
jgi:hypothetical protein